ncbi:hypothetical protein HI914_04444 [Erysiphe necator]|nr:hypothetical protein HI914_04444 [Erysiphe necator]
MKETNTTYLLADNELVNQTYSSIETAIFGVSLSVEFSILLKLCKGIRAELQVWPFFRRIDVSVT